MSGGPRRSGFPSFAAHLIASSRARGKARNYSAGAAEAEAVASSRRLDETGHVEHAGLRAVEEAAAANQRARTLIGRTGAGKAHVVVAEAAPARAGVRHGHPVRDPL